MIDPELLEIYHDLISWDHHKSRDTYFNVEITQSLNGLSFYAYHDGYISEFNCEVDSVQSGWAYLEQQLINAIREQILHVEEVMAMTDKELEDCWLIRPEITKEKLREYKSYIDK